MAVYHKIKCVYVHIPKTGGQSIMSMLSQAEFDCINEGEYELDHLKMKMILDRMKPESHFKFAIVRHPMNRLISEYNFSKKYRPYLPDTESYTFSEYVREISKLNIRELPHCVANHLYPQVEFVYHEDELLVDYIGKFENLDESINYVSQKLNRELPVLPHINKSEKANNFELDSETIKIVQDIYQEDYIRFGYSQSTIDKV